MASSYILCGFCHSPLQAAMPTRLTLQAWRRPGAIPASSKAEMAWSIDFKDDAGRPRCLPSCLNAGDMQKSRAPVCCSLMRAGYMLRVFVLRGMLGLLHWHSRRCLSSIWGPWRATWRALISLFRGAATCTQPQPLRFARRKFCRFNPIRQYD